MCIYENKLKSWLLCWSCLAESVTLRSGVRLSVCPSVRLPRLFLTLMGHAAHSQPDSPGAARDSASVHFRPSVGRTDILVNLSVHFVATL